MQEFYQKSDEKMAQVAMLSSLHQDRLPRFENDTTSPLLHPQTAEIMNFPLRIYRPSKEKMIFPTE
jgi:hypothetical protein